jgi:hypothetical protein
MIRNLFATTILALAIVCAGSTLGMASSAETSDHYAQAKLKDLKQEPHTSGQYQTLAHYYGERQKKSLQQAAEAKAEWERRSYNIMGVLAKYPRPVDSALYLYEYYTAKAEEFETLEAKYRNMAESATFVNAQ